MITLRVDILNPKAEKILKNLEDLNLISIKSTSESDFITVLSRIRAKSKRAPSLEKIAGEVEAVRSKRYGG